MQWWEQIETGETGDQLGGRCPGTPSQGPGGKERGRRLELRGSDQLGQDWGLVTG